MCKDARRGRNRLRDYRWESNGDALAPNGPTISRVIAWLIGAVAVTDLAVVVGTLICRES